jgi:hypothetical protein
MENVLYTYRGKVRLGWNIVFSWVTEFGLGNMKFLKDRVIVSAFPFRKTIPYSKIKNLIWSTAGFVRIEHEAGGLPYVAFWVLGKNNSELTKINKIIKKE